MRKERVTEAIQSHFMNHQTDTWSKEVVNQTIETGRKMKDGTFYFPLSDSNKEREAWSGGGGVGDE